MFSLPFGRAEAAPGINHQLTYYGVLKQGGAAVVDGTYDMVFKIYAAAAGGVALWTGTHTAGNGNAISTTNGNFTALLGSGAGNTMTLGFNDDSYYIGVTVGSDSEMTPRQRLGAAGYAFNADTLDGLDSLNFVTSTRSIFAGAGLTGGGDLSSNRTLSLDINNLTAISAYDDADTLTVYDNSTNNIVKITRANFLSGITGALIYQGAWNATTNSPILADGTGSQGQYYVVGVAGTQNLGSVTSTFTVNDWVVHNGSAWEKLDSTSDVSSVFSRTGIITASTGDYIASQITNTALGTISAVDVQAAINELANEKQASSANLTDIAGLANTNGYFIVGNGNNFITEATSTVRTSLGLGSSDSPTFARLTITASTTFNGIEYLFPSADGSNSQVLTTNSAGRLSWTTVSSGGSSFFTTTSDSLALYPIDPTDVLIIGGSATTTSGNILEVIGSSLFDNVSAGGTLSVTATTTLSGNVIISGKTTLANASSTNQNLSGYLSVAGNSTLATTTATGLTISANGLTLASSTPATSTQALYAQGNALYWNGSDISTAAATTTQQWTFSDNFGQTMLTPSSTIPFWSRGALYASSTVRIAGDTNVGGALSVSSTSTLSGNTIISGNTTLANASSTNQNISGYLIVDGSSIFATTTASNLLTVSQGITIASSTPISTTTYALYNNAGTLYWNGSTVGGGAFGTQGQTITFDSSGIQTATSTLFISSAGNVGIGTSSPGAMLSVTGRIEQTGIGNSVFLGRRAGESDDLSNNTNIFIGNQAGLYNTNGQLNTAVGYQTLQMNTNGDYNLAVGYHALQTGDGGSNNSAIGYDAFRYINGSNNVGSGSGVGYGVNNNSNVSNNTMMGYKAGYSILTGADNNILLGYQAGDNLTTGANNIIIGYDIDATSTTMTSGLNIGNLIFGTNIDGVGTTLSSGNIGIGTTTIPTKLVVSGGITLSSTTPATTTLALYNNAGTLYWNGSDISTAGTNQWTFANNFSQSMLTPSSTIPFWSRGALYASSTLTVDGHTTLTTASSTDQSLSGYLTVSGQTTLANASSTNQNISGYLIIDGSSYIFRALFCEMKKPTGKIRFFQ